MSTYLPKLAQLTANATFITRAPNVASLQCCGLLNWKWCPMFEVQFIYCSTWAETAPDFHVVKPRTLYNVKKVYRSFLVRCIGTKFVLHSGSAHCHRSTVLFDVNFLRFWFCNGLHCSFILYKFSELKSLSFGFN